MPSPVVAHVVLARAPTYAFACGQRPAPKVASVRSARAPPPPCCARPPCRPRAHAPFTQSADWPPGPMPRTERGRCATKAPVTLSLSLRCSGRSSVGGGASWHRLQLHPAPMVGTCSTCRELYPTKEPSRSAPLGSAPHKYCYRTKCQERGKALGHIKGVSKEPPSEQGRRGPRTPAQPQNLWQWDASTRRSSLRTGRPNSTKLKQSMASGMPRQHVCTCPCLAPIL